MMFDLCLLFSSHVCILSKALFHWNAESLLLHEYKANSATHEHVGEDILKHAHACSRCAETSALSVPPTPLTLHVFLLLGVFLVRKGPKKKLFLFFFSSPSSLDAGCVSVEHPSFVTSGRVSFKKNFLFIAGRVSFEKLFCLLPDVSRWKHDCPDPCWEPAPSRQRVSENRSAVARFNFHVVRKSWQEKGRLVGRGTDLPFLGPVTREDSNAETPGRFDFVVESAEEGPESKPSSRSLRGTQEGAEKRKAT